MEPVNGITVICGSGIGKTNAAIGKGIKALGDGKTVTLIHFLKGRGNEGVMRVLKKLEPDLKVFSFERYTGLYEDLPEEEKQEEQINIRNAIGFAKKVLTTGSCDVLILDEILGLMDLGIMTLDEMRRLLSQKPEEMELIITGVVFPEELKDAVNCISEIKTVFSH